MLIPVMIPIAGSVVPRHQASSVKGDASNKYYDVRESKSGSRYFTAFGVDLSPDNMAVAVRNRTLTLIEMEDDTRS
jgi:hypothetical protein